MNELKELRNDIAHTPAHNVSDEVIDRAYTTLWHFVGRISPKDPLVNKLSEAINHFREQIYNPTNKPMTVRIEETFDTINIIPENDPNKLYK